jgi:ATP-dependent Clp protease ATP-binding subunit ClpA
MITRPADGLRAVMTAAHDEARARGDRRIGTEHLLLGLLSDPGTPACRALGVDLETARAALATLDTAALNAVGLDVEGVARPAIPASRKRTPLTSGARAVISRTADKVRRSRSRRITAEHVLLAILACEPPDPAAELLAQLGVDRAAVRAKVSDENG